MNPSNLLGAFLEFSAQVKLYHWQTKNYARHIASENLYNKATKLIDEFIETYQGKHHNRLTVDRNNQTLDIGNLDDEDVTMYLTNFKGFLMEDIPEILNDGMENTDLINIRDEILTIINRTLYLFSLE